MDLHLDDLDSGQNSVVHGADAGRVERVPLRAAGAVAAEMGEDPIDVLKVDVEGCEVQVLESLGPERLARVKVLHVEYDHRSARRRIEDLLRETHELLYATNNLLDQGECTYVSKAVADHPDVGEALASILRRAWT